MLSNRWKVGYRKRGRGFWEGPLVAHWEVAGDPLSDHYTPDEVDAETLFRRWSKGAANAFPDGLIPISWSVDHEEGGRFERMPFEYEHDPGRLDQNFLTFYEWPVHAVTGERLNWLTLPVVDKAWNDQKSITGGFIQEFTGWKPSILQPFVYLPSLVRATIERLEASTPAT